MIYISTACVRTKTIKEAVREIAEQGFSNIELSGGTLYYDNILDDLFELQSAYKLNYLIHNYFPPSKEPFVLNLASLDESIYYKSISHLKTTIDFANRLSCDRIGIHAGFFINPNFEELGKSFLLTKLQDREKSINAFIKAYSTIKTYADPIKVYIENNVIIESNLTQGKDNSLMLTNFTEYKELFSRMAFPLLLDIGHLKVTCRTLSLDFYREMGKFVEVSDYFHLSDNDGYSDSNNSILEDGNLFNILKQFNLKNKTITLEIYRPMVEIKAAYDLILKLVC